MADFYLAPRGMVYVIICKTFLTLDVFCVCKYASLQSFPKSMSKNMK